MRSGVGIILWLDGGRCVRFAVLFVMSEGSKMCCVSLVAGICLRMYRVDMS